MRLIVTILVNSPWWVYALLALLVWLGVQALRTRTVAVWRLLATPVVFIGWGIVSLALRSVSSPVLIADWLATAAIAAAIAWVAVNLDGVLIDRSRQLVTLKGSVVPILRNMLIFLAKYGLGVAIAIAPAFRAELYIWDIAISGATAGYFLGWLARFGSIYRRAPDPALTAPAQP